MRPHHRVDVAGADVAALAPGHRRVDPLQHLVVIGQRQRHAQDLHPGGRGCDELMWLDGGLRAHKSSSPFSAVLARSPATTNVPRTEWFRCLSENIRSRL